MKSLFLKSGLLTSLVLLGGGKALVAAGKGVEKGSLPLTLFVGKPETPSLHPFTINPDLDKNSLYLYFLTAKMVFVPDKENRWVCQMCETFPGFANGLIELLEEPDQPFNMKISLSFKKGLKWGNGQPVTGKDLYFTWQLAKSLPGDFLGKSMFERIEHLVVDDDDPLRVTLYLKESEYLHSDWGQWVILPEALERPVFEKFKGRPEEYLKESHFLKDPFNPGLYSGLYVPVKGSTEGDLTLSKNPARSEGYGGFSPVLVTHTLRQVEGAAVVSETACEKGSCEIPGRKFKEYVGESTAFEQVTLNLRNPILRDQRVRRALYMAVSRDHIYEGIWEKNVAAAFSFLPTASPYFDKDVKFIDYSPEGAGKLLEQSEWVLNTSVNKKNIPEIRNKQANPLDFTLLTSDDPKRMATARYLKDSWEKIGVRVRLEFLDQKNLFKTLKRLDFSGAALFSWDMPLDISLISLFGSYSVPNVKNRYHGQNLSAWMHHSTDRILVLLNREFDFTARKNLLFSLQKNYMDYIPSIPLFFHLRKAVATLDVGGFYIPENSFPGSLWADEWKPRS